MKKSLLLATILLPLCLFVTSCENNAEVKVTTYEPTNITPKSAECGGDVVLNGNIPLSELGVCWSTKRNPTPEDNKMFTRDYQYPFSCKITHLIPGTKYYVRAYVIRGHHEAYYGKEMSFTTPVNPSGGVIEGSLSGKFTVAMGEQVYFSKGNLQFHPVQRKWRFAEHQWDIVGAENANVSENYNGWLDLMGWATSGYNNCNPWMTSSSSLDYGELYVDIAGTNYDWGVYNAISNGGNQKGLWRTLEYSELVYLFETRHTASGSRFAKATVNGIYGVILLPDDWNNSYYSLTHVNDNSVNGEYTYNVISLSDWNNKLENHGAVFLPAGGDRIGTSTHYYSNGIPTAAEGNYWTSSTHSGERAWALYFSDHSCYWNYPAYIGPAKSVRLVRDVE